MQNLCRKSPSCALAVARPSLLAWPRCSWRRSGLEQPAYWLRNFNEKVPLREKFLGPSPRNPSRSPPDDAVPSAWGMGLPLAVSPQLANHHFDDSPGSREVIGSLKAHASKRRVAPQAREVGGGVPARSRRSNSASDFPAPHPSPLWPAFRDCRMPTRFSSRIRSSSRMDRPAACLSD